MKKKIKDFCDDFLIISILTASGLIIMIKLIIG